MNRKLTRAVVVLALLTVLLVVAACGRDNDGAGGIAGAGNYTVTWWESIPGQLAPNFVCMSETYHAQWVMEKTGINIEFLHPPAGQAGEQLSLMISAMDLPDIIVANWHTAVAGGSCRRPVTCHRRRDYS